MIRRYLKYGLIAAAGLFTAFCISLIIPVRKPYFNTVYSTVIFDREGEMIGARIAADGQWRFPSSDSVPVKFEESILAFEDRYFYYHPGVNPVSIFRALKQNLEAGGIVSGGSTITMQLARIMSGNRSRTLFQKLYETWLAFRLEVQMSKKEILLLYATHAPFGGNVVGIEAASWRYFGRPATDLSWAEAAALAVLPNSPSLIYPGKNNQELRLKRDRLLEYLESSGKIKSSVLELAVLEPVPGKPHELPSLSSHLLDRVMLDGLGENRIRTSIDKQLQERVVEYVKLHQKTMSASQVHNTAVLVTDIQTGEALAYVGNSASGKEHAESVDMITGLRSPGSLLKPVLYALSIDEGIIGPYQLLPDVPSYYQGFSPQNFNKNYSGAVKANLALRSSLNVPFVSLLKDYGYERFHHRLQRAGIESIDRESGHYGLSLILGGSEVTMWEMASLYGGLVRGTLVDPVTGKQMLPVKSTYLVNEGSTAETFNSIAQPGALWHTLKAMQQLRRPDSESNWEMFGSARPIAWKTGTSYGHKDAWSIGMNTRYLVAVWTGNSDGEGRPELVGVTAAAPLMFKVFGLLEGDADFQMPRGLKTIRICAESGMQASAICPITHNEFVFDEGGAVCTYHRWIYLDKTGSFRVNGNCYPLDMARKEAWFVLPPTQAHYYKQENANYQEIPRNDIACSDPGESIMEMIYPRQNTKVYIPVEIDRQDGEVVFEAAHMDPGATIYWHLDEQYLGSTWKEHQMPVDPPHGEHRLKLFDDEGRELSMTFTVLNDTR